jgi:hypothetical protein
MRIRHICQEVALPRLGAAEPLRAYIEDVLQVRPKFENEFLSNVKLLKIYA